MIDSKREAELIELYYSNLNDAYFLDALKSYSEGKGFGIGDIWCVFAEEFEPGEEDYFGEKKVAYCFDYPAVAKDEVLIVDDSVFYRYLQEASIEFLKRNPAMEIVVEEWIEKIRNWIDLN
ncbi:hypothetical protein CDO73_07735 [Saccharibacillus sp. O23]|uniref:ribonuclease toxin immunity protein CdiI n=1 Tax=Saccharibacillus sp. O23 TaxID=2009338 RepID=UPI000B4E3385|nr:ribonuclease toxin immunity protein CdiI [Saccharibacillus sp. O23]OWR31283.1 hypothetical protein CDO73_07735 [Saccharibacillus sp. O23]